MRRNIVVDIDGTIVDISHRLKFIKKKPKDWNNFYAESINDKPIGNICRLVYTLGMKYKIVFCTGRRESIREETLMLLSTILGVYFNGYDGILMRKEEDYRKDTIVKPELLSNAGITTENTELILEDRTSVVNEYRKLGFTVLQVADGDF